MKEIIMSTWTQKDINSMEGKVVIVTGGNSGIGLETSKELTRVGATVIIAANREDHGQAAIEEIKSLHKNASIFFEKLDLGSMASITSFSDRIMQEHRTVDVLINNAGLSAIQKRMETHDGHELTLGVNYLGHFALTAQLFPLLLRGSDPRIIFVSSLEHRRGEIHFSDIELQKKYSPADAYAQSKLAMLVFALELHRRCLTNGLNIKVIPVHPGATNTHIFDKGPKLSGKYLHPVPVIKRFLLKSLGQKAQTGALPLLFSATSVEARSGIYYGPDGPSELWGNPTEVKIAVQAANFHAGVRLWNLSEKLTKINFDVTTSKSIGLH
jgi:NAD(P)-dependent dehydrogenase (short-subunit alcohol dehydrogenase family)